MNSEQIWNCEKPVAELLDCDIPDWIEREDIRPSTIASICQGGCASGAYMPCLLYTSAPLSARRPRRYPPTIRRLGRWGPLAVLIILSALMSHISVQCGLYNKAWCNVVI